MVSYSGQPDQANQKVLPFSEKNLAVRSSSGANMFMVALRSAALALSRNSMDVPADENPAVFKN